MNIDKSAIYAPLDPFMRTVTVMVSLRLDLPGGRPFYLEGLKLLLDRLHYEQYKELGDLDQYLHFEAVQALMKNSTVHRVVIGHPGDTPFPVGGV